MSSVYKKEYIFALVVATFVMLITLNCSSETSEAKKEFKQARNIFVDECNLTNDILDTAANTRNFTGLEEAIQPNLQRLENAYEDMVVKAQDLEGEARAIADEQIRLAREHIDNARGRLTAGGQMDINKYNSINERERAISQRWNSLNGNWESLD